MDFILSKIENKLRLNDPGSYEYITYLKMRIEYSLFLCLGFLWNNLDQLTQEKREHIFKDLNSLSIGSIVSAIRELDRQAPVILVDKKCRTLFDDYPSIRNSKIGHGYSMADSIASSLTPLYTDIANNVPLIKENCDIVIVKNFNSETNTFGGIRLPFDQNGEGERWSCPLECFKESVIEFPQTYISYKNAYYKISPFVYVDPETQLPFVFNSLTEKVVGKTKLCALFSSATGNDKIEHIFKELIYLSKSDGNRLFSQSNGTIMNKFKLNYTQYIDVGFQNLVRKFLYENRAYVTATIWGHGGVGKTACIQKMCYDLFNDTTKRFSYIVFITAKDRVFNPKTGEINRCVGNARLYSDVIETIVSTVFDSSVSLSNDSSELEMFEQRIREFEDQLLIVIDDYETFEDCEKEKISNFLSSLNARYHKAVITTRNNRFVIGENIPSNELDVLRTKQFIEGTISAEYKDHLTSIRTLLSDNSALNFIHTATSGRPIFIYQFIHLYVQKGYKDELIKGIRTSKNAQEFLYGRIVSYLSQNAQRIFATISILVDSDLRFNLEILEHVLSKSFDEKDQFISGLDEIVNQKVIERINDIYGRVYSMELISIMKTRYKQYPSDFRDTVKNLLDSIGGKDLKGSIIEAMLEQADKSRAFGNEQETVEKYRRVLNAPKCPPYIRKAAIKHMADYLSNARLNPMAAIAIMEEYIPNFAHDVDIYSFYIFLLWSQGKEEKEKAVYTISKFFSSSSHKKTAPNNLVFFALCVGYCIDFDIQYRTYTSEKLRKAQYLKTFNEYGKELFDYIKRTSLLTGKAALFHNIRVALIQTIKLCVALSKYESNGVKLAYGMDICTWMQKSKLKEPFLSQINRLQNELQNKAGNKVIEKSVAILDAPEPQMEAEESDGFLGKCGQYCVGDVVDVKIQRIMNYGAFAEIETSISGLIHISEIADRYIENIYSEFAIGEIRPAKIIGIEKPHNKINLSTKGV